MDVTADNKDRLGTLMKEYRLVAWPELQQPFDRTAYRRMLSDMLHRYMSVAQLVSCSGLKRHEVIAFIEGLEVRGLLSDRGAEATEPDSVFDSLRPIGGWIRNALHLHDDR